MTFEAGNQFDLRVNVKRKVLAVDEKLFFKLFTDRL